MCRFLLLFEHLHIKIIVSLLIKGELILATENTTANKDFENIDLEEDDLTTGDKLQSVFEKRGKPFLRRLLTRFVVLVVAICLGICTVMGREQNKM